MRLWNSLALALASLGSSLPLAAQRVLTVDDDQPADYANIQLAVDAAADGDILLIRDGVYPPRVVIDGKGLVLLHDRPASGPVGEVLIGGLGGSLQAPQLLIRNLDASQAVLVRGVSISFCFLLPGTVGTLVSDCDGLVLLEDCRLQDPADCIVVSQTESALVVERSLGVVLTRCALFGNNPLNGTGTYPGTSLFCEASGVTVYESSFSGGPGSCTIFGPGRPAAPAIFVESGTLFLAGSQATGGAGAQGCAQTGGIDGGAALELGAGAPEVEVFDCQLVGGAAGSAGGGPGLPGTPILVGSGSAYEFVVASPAAGLRAASYSGTPGAAFAALRSLEPYVPTPGPFVGRRLVGEPFKVPDHGRVGPAGSAQTLRSLPVVPPGAEGVAYVEQALFLDAGGLVAGPPSVLVVVE